MDSKFSVPDEVVKAYTRLEVTHDYLQKRDHEWDTVFDVLDVPQILVDSLNGYLFDYKRCCDALLNTEHVAKNLESGAYKMQTYTQHLAHYIEVSDVLINMLNRLQTEHDATQMLTDLLGLSSSKKSVSINETDLILGFNTIQQKLADFLDSQTKLEYIELPEDES